MLTLGWRSIVGPSIFAVVAVALLVYDHLNQRVPALVFWLTLGLIVAVFARTLVTLREQSTALEWHGESARSDQVIGLENRQRLEADIKTAAAAGSRGADRGLGREAAGPAGPESVLEKEALDEVERAIVRSHTAEAERCPHREPVRPDEALAELRRNSGTQFDPRIVEALAIDLAEEASPVTAPFWASCPRRSFPLLRSPSGPVPCLLRAPSVLPPCPFRSPSGPVRSRW